LILVENNLDAVEAANAVLKIVTAPQDIEVRFSLLLPDHLACPLIASNLGLNGFRLLKTTGSKPVESFATESRGVRLKPPEACSG